MFTSTISAIEYFEILLPLALILILSKSLSIGCKKIGFPEVVGVLIAGLILGCIKYIPNQTILSESTMEGLSFMAKIGVILIMFSAGLETDLKMFKKTSGPSVIITLFGVIFPVALGFIIATAFTCGFKDMSQHDILSNLFYGTILAATSVSITVACLKEIGKLNSKAGSSIIAAAVLDDIIGVIILSIIISISKGDGIRNLGPIVGKMIAFFALAILLGLLLKALINHVSKRWPHTRRTPIFSLVICFLFAYLAEKFFSVADITGAYIAGIVLSTVKEEPYIDKKVNVINYMIFAPVFFANIGINASFSSLNESIVAFGFAFIVVGLLGKLIGCGLGSLICKYSFKDSFRVGIGMMCRAEVVLVCTQKGIDSGLIDPNILPFVLILIITSTLIVPITLKKTYKFGELSFKTKHNFEYSREN